MASMIIFASERTSWAAAEEPSAPSLPTAEEVPEPDRIAELEARLADLEARMAQQEVPPEASPIFFNGYVDFGFFVPLGNLGVGWVRDFGNTQFPQYSNFGWTFLGDILATTVNTRGEVADLGDAPGINRFDSINSDGAAGFLVNEVNARLGYQLSENATLRTSINFVPRSGATDFSLGDFFDVDIAELEYVLTEDGGTSVFVGKMLPVFGIEYKERKSDQRFGITPSLIHRYTSGNQLGLKFRSKLINNWVIVAGSLTNNSSGTEQFHFYSEVDRNSGKTLNGRVAINVPVDALISSLLGDSLEIGFSVMWGPQDRATDNSGSAWMIGADLTYSSANFALKAQWVRGKSPGRPEERVWELNLHHSGYVELDWMVFPFLGVLARAELRDAEVFLTNERYYLTKGYRITGGLRAVFNPHVALKAEYLHNGEFGGISPIANDIVTSSLVLSY